MATATAQKATTTTPRKRAPRASAAKVEPVAAPEPAQADKFIVELEYVEDTKTYAKFQVPANLKGTMVGNLYAPLGTSRVKVAIFGADSESEETDE